MLFSIFVGILVTCTHSAEESHDGHDHGEGASNFEWAGIFPTPNSMYLWTAQKVEGAYVDPAMKMAALPADADSEDGLHLLESEGAHALEQNCTPLQHGDVIVPEMDKCYSLQFDESIWQTLFMVNASSTPAIAFFTEHFPTEFEATAHYLKDSIGDDIEPTHELPEEAPALAKADNEEADKPWGPVLGAALIVNFITLIGAVAAIPAISKFMASHMAQVEGVVAGFAAGALLACAFFLLLFEATHLVASGWAKEVEVLWRWGIMILAGFLVPGFVDLLVLGASAKKAEPPQTETVCQEAEGLNKGQASSKARLMAGVLIGDFFHNLCDVFFLGAAFKGCGDTFGWGVAAGTICHEIPQEMADYTILTGPGVGLSPSVALLLNFGSGLSVLLGAVIVVASEIDNGSVGLLLAFGGGVYLHIGATECMPKIYNEKLALVWRVACIVAFVVGAVVIGLVLLDHEHCVPESTNTASEAASSGGHAH